MKVAPRTITFKQITNFLFLTERIPKIPIGVRTSRRGDDTATFGYQLRHMLNTAGFTAPTNSGDWGLSMGAADPIFARKVGQEFDWPNVVVVSGGDSRHLPRFLVQQTDTWSRPIVTNDSVGVIYAAVGYCLTRVGINAVFDTNGPASWLKPGEWELVVTPKNN
jgi:hypothetical protein